jgi:putative transposase
MLIYRAYKTELKLNNRERTLLVGCAGAARFAFNWGLSQKISEYAATGKSPNYYELHRRLNALKKEEQAWFYQYSKTIPQEALRDLEQAFQNFFRRVKNGEKPGFPRFKSRKQGIGSFRLHGSIRVEAGRIKLPRIGWLRLQEKDYLPTTGVKILSATLSERAGRWFIALQVEEEIADRTAIGPVVGVDLGIKSLAVTSSGVVYENPNALRHALKRLARLQRELARRQKGSHNRAKTRARIAQLHDRITCLRQNAIHQTTSRIVAKTKPDIQRPALVVMEDLNVAGMMQNGKLARAVADVGMGEFARQMAYKCAWNGTKLVQANRWFPSSKQCSRCGQVKTALALAERVFRCEACGLEIDRDHNAARNLMQLGTARSTGGDGPAIV